jgi:hypothetical protein
MVQFSELFKHFGVCFKVTQHFPPDRQNLSQASTVAPKLSDLPEGSSYYEEESMEQTEQTVEVDLDANETTENAKQKSAL